MVLIEPHQKDFCVDERISIFKEFGYVIVPIPAKTKLVCFHSRNARFDIFLKRQNKKLSIVVHPDSAYGIAGKKFGKIANARYHNSNLAGFPKEVHKG